MRRFLVITLALAAGALVVTGQDGDASKLMREIEQLTKRLRTKADAAKVRSIDAVPVLRLYDVADIVATVRHRTIEFSNLAPSGYEKPEQRETEELPAMAIDSLIEMIRQGVEPATWDSIEGASIEPKGGRLFVQNLPRVHKKTGRLLAWQRSNVRRVTVEVAAVALNDADRSRVAAVRRDLPPALARELLSRNVLARLSFVGRSGQTLAGRSGRTVRYVAQYNPEIAQASSIGDPITHDLFLGLAAEMTACVDRNTGGAIVHTRISLTSADQNFPVQKTEHGPLELPRMELTRSISAFWMPLDRTVVAGGGTIDNKTVVFLVTVRRRP